MKTRSKPQHTCGCRNHKKPGLFARFLSLFASKEEKALNKDETLMAEFEQTQLQAGQDELNRIVEHCAGALGTVATYEEASDALMKGYDKGSLDGLAHSIDEIRYAAQGIGGAHG